MKTTLLAYFSSTFLDKSAKNQTTPASLKKRRSKAKTQTRRFALKEMVFLRFLLFLAHRRSRSASC